MSQGLWIIIISILISIVIIFTYLKTTQPSKRYEFNSIATLCQTILIFVALFISIYVVISNRKDTQDLFNKLQTFYSQFSKMDSSLESVSIKLKEMPQQIDIFSESIDSLNSGIIRQGKDFKANTLKLNTSINSLSTSVKDYENNIQNYSTQLETITKLTTQQLAIWKDQQRVMLDEFTRKPKFKLETKDIVINNDTLIINNFIFTNMGNIEATILGLMIKVRIGNNISIKSDYFNMKDEDNDYFFYSSNVSIWSNHVMAAGAIGILPCNLKLLKKKGIPLSIGYQIEYTSKYDSDVKLDSIVIK